MKLSIVMNSTKNYSICFWIFENKFDAFLTMVASLVDYDFFEEERDIIKVGIRLTNEEKDLRFKYVIKGNLHVNLVFAYDSEDRDIIHIDLNACVELKEKLEVMIMFLDTFSELKRVGD